VRDDQGQPDEVIFATAQSEGWTVLTENVADYLPIAAAHHQRGHAHAGLVLTSHRRFPRSDARTVGRIITALDTFLSAGLVATNLEYWLE
jgi:hypothetical protein